MKVGTQSNDQNKIKKLSFSTKVFLTWGLLYNTLANVKSEWRPHKKQYIDDELGAAIGGGGGVLPFDCCVGTSYL